MSKYNKAIAAAVSAIAASLLVFNIDLSPAVQASLITVITGIGTLISKSNSLG